MIDLSKFVSATREIVPVVEGAFQFNRKKYKTKTKETGWFLVEMKGNDASLIERQYFVEVKKPVYGYTFANSIIFQNFDSARRRFNIKDGQAKLYFNTADTFSSIKAVYWEDKNFYFTDINYNDLLIFEIKNAFDNDVEITGIKGVTPELRTLYVLHSIQKKEFLELIRKAEQEKQKAEFRKTITGRIQVILERVGGKLIDIEKKDDKIIIDWKLDGGDYEYNTVLGLDGQIIEAGFCMRGSDKEFNLTGLALTAKEWEKGNSYNNTIHITRYKNDPVYEYEDYE